MSPVVLTPELSQRNDPSIEGLLAGAREGQCRVNRMMVMRIVRNLLAASVPWLGALLGSGPRPLPDQAPHQIAHLGEFQFEGGGKIPN
jgi:hypothetical protein